MDPTRILKASLELNSAHRVHPMKNVMEKLMPKSSCRTVPVTILTVKSWL